MRGRFVQTVLLILCLVVAVLLTLPRLVDEDLHKVLKKASYAASEGAIRLHQDLTIADLHADSLLCHPTRVEAIPV